MRRGEFIAIVCGAALSLPFPAQAQQLGKVPRIAFLATPDASTKQRVACFKDGLRWIEGQNIAIDVRVSDGSIETNRSIVAELNALKFDLIVSYGTPSTQVMRQAIQNTPVLFLMVSDPVASGSYRRPKASRIRGRHHSAIEQHHEALTVDAVVDRLPDLHVAKWRVRLRCIEHPGPNMRVAVAEPSIGFFKKGDPRFGNPKNDYKFDPAMAKKLLAEAGYGPSKPAKGKIMISTSGSGQMLPLPMNEFLQQSMKQCGFDITFEVVEWGTMLVAFRAEPTAPQAANSDGMNISLVSSDVSVVVRWFYGENVTPKGSNWGHWRNPEFDALLLKMVGAANSEEFRKALASMHEILVDEAPWAWIVHDRNPRAMTKQVQGFVSAQSWFQDLTRVSLK